MKSLGDNISSKFDFLKKEDDEVNALKKRIEELEAKLKKANTAKKKTVCKKDCSEKITRDILTIKNKNHEHY